MNNREEIEGAIRALKTGHDAAIEIHMPGPYGWCCEECLFETEDDQSALDHADQFKHSLARGPIHL